MYDVSYNGDEWAWGFPWNLWQGDKFYIMVHIIQISTESLEN